MDHAGAGALVLEQWKLPEAYAEALRFHHEPHLTASKLAALLYLVEFWTASEEDPASQARLNAALDRVGLTLDSVMRLRLPTSSHVNRIGGVHATLRL
jgi:HD-like signal output (HDOD) protein